MSKETFEEFRARFNKNLFDEYAVTMRLKDVAGGIPATPGMIDTWIDMMCKDKSEEERQKIKEATVEDLPEAAEDIASRSWTCFKRDDTGPYIEGRCLKAALKEAANIVKTTLTPTKKTSKAKGIANLKKHMAETVFVVDDKIYFLRDGKPVEGEIPTEERPIHVMTPRGPRTSLKKTDVLKDVELQFAVRLAKTGAVTEEALWASLAYLEFLGVGTDRSQGRGQGRAPSSIELIAK